MGAKLPPGETVGGRPGVINGLGVVDDDIGVDVGPEAGVVDEPGAAVVSDAAVVDEDSSVDAEGSVVDDDSVVVVVVVVVDAPGGAGVTEFNIHFN